MFPIFDPIERQRVEWVHGLTGGELADHPLRILDTAGRGRFWARYWYDGAPEWSNEHAYDSGRRGWRGSWRTLVWNSGSYGDFLPPASFRDSSGRRWRKVRSYNSGAECECPVPENHPGRVTRAEAKLTDKLAEDSPLRRMRAPTLRPYTARRAECPLCEARVGEDHGYIYLGEGWLEAVYYSPDQED